MKKKYCFFVFFIYSLYYTQVGINIPNDKKDFNISFLVCGKPNDKNIADGIIPPKIQGSKLAKKDSIYNTETDGAIIYVTKGIPHNKTTSKTQYIKKKGYYFYDAYHNNGIWKPIYAKEEKGNYVILIKDQEVNGIPNSPTPLLLNSIISFNKNKDIKLYSPENNNSFTDIVLPPNKLFKLTGYIGINEKLNDKASSATYIKSRFALIDPQKITDPVKDENYEKLLINTWGFSKSSTEINHSGGNIPPICFIKTKDNEVIIRLMLQKENQNQTVLFNNSQLNSLKNYILVEEI